MSSSLPTAPGITPLALAGTYPPGCLNPLTLDRVFSSRRRPQLQQPPALCPGTSAARRGRIACSRSRPAGLPGSRLEGQALWAGIQARSGGRQRPPAASLPSSPLAAASSQGCRPGPVEVRAGLGDGVLRRGRGLAPSWVSRCPRHSGAGFLRFFISDRAKISENTGFRFFFFEGFWRPHVLEEWFRVLPAFCWASEVRGRGPHLGSVSPGQDLASLTSCLHRVRRRGRRLSRRRAFLSEPSPLISVTCGDAVSSGRGFPGPLRRSDLAPCAWTMGLGAPPARSPLRAVWEATVIAWQLAWRLHTPESGSPASPLQP